MVVLRQEGERTPGESTAGNGRLETDVKRNFSLAPDEHLYDHASIHQASTASVEGTMQGNKRAGRGVMVPRREIWAALTILGVLSAAPAHANDVAVSKEHFRRAVKLSELGKHQESIREFELSYEANPRPNTLYNIAQEHRVLAEAGALEEMRKSVDFYQRYLAMAPRVSDRRLVEGYIAELKARIESAEAAARETAVQPLGLPEKAPVTDAPRTDEAVVGNSPAVPPGKSPTKVPAWGWALVGVGSAVVVGGAIALGVGFSSTDTWPMADYMREARFP